MKEHGGTVQDDERFLRAYAQKNNFDKVTAILKVFIDKKSGQYPIPIELGDGLFASWI